MSDLTDGRPSQDASVGGALACDLDLAGGWVHLRLWQFTLCIIEKLAALWLLTLFKNRSSDLE